MFQRAIYYTKESSDVCVYMCVCACVCMRVCAFLCVHAPCPLAAPDPAQPLFHSLLPSSSVPESSGQLAGWSSPSVWWQSVVI